MNPHEHSTRFRFKEESYLVGSFGSSRVQVFDADGGIKVTRGSMMILKGEHIAKLCKLTGSIIVGDASAATEKEDTTRRWHMRLSHMSE